jgi:amino acid transporter
MAQESVTQETASAAQGDEHHSNAGTLGPLLCWAVVFADIGTSVYYVPGILSQTVHSLAGFFVFLTMSVFVLLTLKYVEVTHRFPQGGGVVTVAAQAINPWFGALGGMFILVDYFLTAAISSLSGIIYLSVVAPALTPYVLWITVGILALLGLLNWIGISESARVSLVGAVIAFLSDLAILFTVFSHLSFGEFLSLFPKMFAGQSLTVTSLLAGFAGSFLAFSGLESISQLSPVMKQPHKKVAGLAMLFVVLTVGLTSPLLTMFSTLLLPDAANSSTQSAQIISLLAGHWGNIALQTEVAISACALLIFASNTAIIGAYHVFMALSRMDFLPGIILQRNKLRGTPHYSIALATGIPIIVLIAVKGDVNVLGDMYAFGLLGAFTLTCFGLDIVRFREWRRAARIKAAGLVSSITQAGHNGQLSDEAAVEHALNGHKHIALNGTNLKAQIKAELAETRTLWFKIKFFLGILTTLLVAIAWSTNLVTKPLATAFGGTVAGLGMLAAYFNYTRRSKQGLVPVPVVVTTIRERLPNSILAVLIEGDPNNNAVIHAAVNDAAENKKPVTFLYLATHRARETVPSMMEIVDPYLEDTQAKETFGKAESLAIKANVPNRRYVYLRGEPGLIMQVWQYIHPHDTVVAASTSEQQFADINPDRVRYELTPDGKVAHLLKRWQT